MSKTVKCNLLDNHALKKKCSMSKVTSVEVFKPTPNTLNMHVVGTSRNDKNP